MQNIPSELIISVENYIYITSFKMKGSPDLGQADVYSNSAKVCKINDGPIEKVYTVQGISSVYSNQNYCGPICL